MKKILIGILIGWILHMLYFDSIIIYQHKLIEKCPENEILDETGTSQCLKNANNIYDKFYSKYFGIYYLLTYKKVVTGPWKAE